ELGVADEQLGTAGPAGVDALGLGVDVLAGERPLGAGLAEHVVLLGAEDLAPLLLGLLEGEGLLLLGHDRATLTGAQAFPRAGRRKGHGSTPWDTATPARTSRAPTGWFQVSSSASTRTPSRVENTGER